MRLFEIEPSGYIIDEDGEKPVERYVVFIPPNEVH